MNDNKLIDAAKELLHLHLCEQEGLSSGQPTRNQWLEAVDNLSKALEEYTGPTVEKTVNEQACDLKESVKNVFGLQNLTVWHFEKIIQAYASQFRASAPEVGAKNYNGIQKEQTFLD